jgi:hypothetical protein
MARAAGTPSHRDRGATVLSVVANRVGIPILDMATRAMGNMQRLPVPALCAAQAFWDAAAASSGVVRLVECSSCDRFGHN